MNDVLELIEISKIHPAPDNPRREVGDVSELALSIKEQGVQQPLVVRRNADGYELVIGERRWTAAKIAGLKVVPAVIREYSSDAARQEAMLVENLQRSDLKPMEEAGGYKRLTEIGVTQRELAPKIGRSQSHISKRLALLDVPEVGQEALDSGRITLEDALELRKLKEMPKRASMAIRNATGNGWMDMERAVKEQLSEHVRAEKRGELLEQLKKEACKVIDRHGNTNAKTRRLGKHYGEVPLTKAKHKKEPCHAAYLAEDSWSSTVKIVYVCTDPSRHTKKGASDLKMPRDDSVNRSERRVDVKQREQEKAEREAKVRRIEHMRSLVVGKEINAKKTLEILAGGVIDRALFDAQVIAVDILGIDLEKYKSGRSKNVRGALEAFIKAKPDNVRRAAIALSFANDELGIRYSWIGTDGKRHLKRLAEFGYELSDVEKEKLDAAADDACPLCLSPNCDETCEDDES